MENFDPDPKVPSGKLMLVTGVLIVFVFVLCYLGGAPT